MQSFGNVYPGAHSSCTPSDDRLHFKWRPAIAWNRLKSPKMIDRASWWDAPKRAATERLTELPSLSVSLRASTYELLSQNFFHLLIERIESKRWIAVIASVIGEPSPLAQFQLIRLNTRSCSLKVSSWTRSNTLHSHHVHRAQSSCTATVHMVEIEKFRKFFRILEKVFLETGTSGKSIRRPEALLPSNYWLRATAERRMRVDQRGRRLFQRSSR